MPFQPGVSGNPGGRPAKDKEVEVLAQEHGPAAIALIAKIMNDEKAEKRLRVDCAKYLTDRAYGKAPQAMTLNTPPGGLVIKTVQFGAPDVPLPGEQPTAGAPQHAAH